MGGLLWNLGAMTRVEGPARRVKLVRSTDRIVRETDMLGDYVWVMYRADVECRNIW